MDPKTQIQDQRTAIVSVGAMCEVYFDGGCPICRAEIGYYRRQGAIADFHDIHTADAALPDSVTREQALARFHVRTPQGELVSGARAFAELWKVTPGWRWLGHIAALPPMTWLLELGYRLFLPVRAPLQRVWRLFAR